LIFYHPAQVKAVTRGTAKPGPNPVYASDTKRISHFLIENCAVRYIPAYYVRFGSKADIEAPSPDVRFGSEADIGLPLIDVRFTPESGHQINIGRLSGLC
jgi:hypothetical protein